MEVIVEVAVVSVAHQVVVSVVHQAAVSVAVVPQVVAVPHAVVVLPVVVEVPSPPAVMPPSSSPIVSRESSLLAADPRTFLSPRT